MNNLRNYIMFSLFALFLVFAGCTTDTDARNSGFGGGSSGGSSGIELEFAEGNPPSEMFKGQPYTFAFVIRNLQEHEINDLQIRTKGFDRGFVSGLAENYNVDRLQRSSSQADPGLYTGLIVQGVTVDGFTGDFNFNPEFDMCYTAKTNFRQQICIPSTSNTCDVDVSNEVNSNGPLSVDVSNINAIGDNIRIDFQVRNSGSGNVVNTCFSADEYTAQYSAAATLGTTNGNCNPSGTNEFLIAGETAAFYCEFERTSDSSYSSQLNVELEYGYEQSHREQILVRDLNQGLN